MTAPASTRTRVRQTWWQLLAVANAALGGWLIALPFVFHLPTKYPHQVAFVNSLVVGTLVLLASCAHGLSWTVMRPASNLNVMLGLYLAVSPLTIGYTKYLANGTHVAWASTLSGLAIAALAVGCLTRSEGVRE
jgi:hypothetical protein